MQQDKAKKAIYEYIKIKIFTAREKTQILKKKRKSL